jgi:hypothetical protein
VIIVVAYLLVLASVPLLGGSLTSLGRLRVRRVWTIALAMALQVLIVNIVERHISGFAAAALHLSSYGLALAFVASNRRLPGIAIIVAGGLANLAAITANGGVMPASPSAMAAAGRATAADTFQNSAATADARLWYLGDVFAWPEPLPLANVFSVGDVAIVVGAAVTAHSAGASRPVQAIRRRRSELPVAG